MVPTVVHQCLVSFSTLAVWDWGSAVLCLFWNQRMVWIGRDFKDLIQLQPPVFEALPWPHPVWPWTPLEMGASTASLGNLCQHLTTLSVKTFPLTSNLNLPSFSFKAILPCPITVRSYKKSVPLLLISSLKVLEDHTQVFLEPSVLQRRHKECMAFYLLQSNKYYN